MNEKGNSILGFALIGLILIGFSWYNTKKAGEQAERQRFIRDSIAMVEARSYEAQLAAADTSAVEAAVGEEFAPLYQSQMLNEASASKTEYYTIENDKLSITLTSLGAQPYKVLVKDYYTYDSLDLYLIRPGKSSFDLEINADQ